MDEEYELLTDLIQRLRRPLAMRVSYTKLDCYQSCPKKYKFQYIERATEAPNEKLLIGQAVHTALETWVAEGGEDLGDLMDFFAAAIAKERTQAPISVEEEDAARQMLMDYYDKLQVIDRERIVAVEYPFELFIDNIIVTGVIDRAEFEDETEEVLFIRDYKTGRYSISNKQAGDNLQMAIYSLAAKEKWPQAKRIICEFIYTRLGKNIKHEFTEEELLKHRQNMVETSINMRLDDRFRPQGKPFQCANCPFASQCGWGKKQKALAERIKAKRDRNLACKNDNTSQ